MEEIWKDVPGYEGLYQVSNIGRVKAIAKIDGKGKPRKERMLKPYITEHHYYRVGLVKEGQRKHYLVHRLVATAFIPNINNLPFINHRDECGLNNCVENLEWCDFEYNITYGTAIERKSKTQINGKRSKKIGQFSLTGELYKEWISAAEYERQTGNSRFSLYNCANGHTKSAYGFKWSYL